MHFSEGEEGRIDLLCEVLNRVSVLLSDDLSGIYVQLIVIGSVSGPLNKALLVIGTKSFQSQVEINLVVVTLTHR
jgi:hypothetical protein